MPFFTQLTTLNKQYGIIIWFLHVKPIKSLATDPSKLCHKATPRLLYTLAGCLYTYKVAFFVCQVEGES